jgi:predicted transcriptional regulator
MEKEDFDLTEVEFCIFKKLVEKGETPLCPIIKEIGIHKGTAYNSIRRLQEKGFVSFREINGVNTYSPNIFFLKNQLENEKEKFEGRIKSIKDVITLVESKKKVEEVARVNILVGEKGFKSFFNELFNWAQKTKKEYLFIGRGGMIAKNLGEEFYKLTQEKKKRLKIKCRVILNCVALNESINQYVAGNVRYLKMPYTSPTSTWIFGDTLCMTLWDACPLLTIVIESRGASESYRDIFEAIWKISSNNKDD